MATIDINDLGRIGAVTDTPAYQLPPEIFTTALNMRVVDGGLEKSLGWSQIFGTPGVAPHFALAVRTASATFWLYVSLAKAYGYDGTTHTDITRASGGDYTATDTYQWNGTLLGGVPIINNGIDVPQFWSTVALATPLTALTNWPSTLRAKIIRAFGPFLMAFNCTKSGTTYPHMVKWSHPAVPGSVPSSWDETDATKDTGEEDLADVNAGVLVEALPLSDTMFAYKEASTWKIRYVGGRAIFDVGKGAWLTTSGVLASRCATVTGDGKRHVVATQDDIIWHDGNQVKSVLQGRQRKRLFNEIDTTNYGTSFIFDNPLAQEIWFCYPTSGATQPNKALVMNYSTGDTWAVTEADGITFRNAITGTIESPSEETWDGTEDLWDDDTGPWAQLARRRVVLCGTNATKFYNLDSGTTRDGTSFTGTIQRIGLSLLGRKRNGDWIVDFEQRKLGTRLWPKIQGGPVDVRFGAQEVVNGAVAWSPVASYDPSTEMYVDCDPVNGRALAIEISSANSWRIDGYKYDVSAVGMF